MLASLWKYLYVCAAEILSSMKIKDPASWSSNSSEDKKPQV